LPLLSEKHDNGGIIHQADCNLTGGDAWDDRPLETIGFEADLLDKKFRARGVIRLVTTTPSNSVPASTRAAIWATLSLNQLNVLDVLRPGQVSKRTLDLVLNGTRLKDWNGRFSMTGAAGHWLIHGDYDNNSCTR
jgi:hypothetical protein